MKILITGGAGFIGSHLVEHFHADHEVVVIDNFRTGYARNLNGFRHTLHEACITDRAAVERAMEGVDLVFHLAALVSVPESMDDPIECARLNVMGLLNVLEAAAANGVRKLVFASSAAVYGDNPTVPKRETMLPEPKSPYAITKLDGEHYLEMFHREGRIETASLRFFNVFGPRQDPNGAYAAAVPIFIHKALNGEPLTIFGDGEQTRDFIYVKDIVAALVHVASSPGLHGTFNAGYGSRITINHLAREILHLTGSTSSVDHRPTRAGDVKHSMASIEKLLSTGFRHVSSLEEGLAATIDEVSALAEPSSR